MNHYVLKQNNTIYKIELNPPRDLSDFIIGPVEMTNDRFTKHSVTVNLEGFMYKIDDAEDDELNDMMCTRILRTETFEEYLQKKATINTKNLKWIYNIIDGISEQSNILYRDDECVIIPTYTYNNIKKLHVLGIVTDKSIMTVRDLCTKDVLMLEHIRDKGLEIIKNTFNIDKNVIRIYLHYPPSTWLLHIHFEIISNTSPSCATEYCHNLSHVIYNLKLDNDYYRNMIMDILHHFQ